MKASSIIKIARSRRSEADYTIDDFVSAKTRAAGKRYGKRGLSWLDSNKKDVSAAAGGVAGGLGGYAGHKAWGRGVMRAATKKSDKALKQARRFYSQSLAAEEALQRFPLGGTVGARAYTVTDPRTGASRMFDLGSERGRADLYDAMRMWETEGRNMSSRSRNILRTATNKTGRFKQVAPLAGLALGALGGYGLYKAIRNKK